MFTRLLLAALLFAPCLAGGAARAAEAGVLSSNEVDLVHFAFASQLGSGIYSVDGRTLQIYRLPFSWRVAEPEDGRPGLRLRLPATIGLFDFEAADLVEEGLPDQFDSVSLGLGVELDLPLGERWTLLPYAEAGRAWQVGDGTDYRTWSASVHVRCEYPLKSSRLRLQAGALWAGVEDLYGARGDFARVEAGVEGRWMLDFELAGETADLGAYLLAEWYFDQPEEPVMVRTVTAEASPQQFELGVSFGTEPPARLWRIPLPRIGIAWRFGDKLSVFRLVFGAAF
jgi:hypothetical protein